MNTRFITLTNRFFMFAFALAFISLLSACGGDDAPANQNASGLYLNGSGTLDGVSGLTDITAFVYNNEIILHSVAAHVLLKGTINSITESAYTATVAVYKNGSRQMPDVRVTGTVNNASQITGTLQGSGVGSGNFAITYSSAFNSTASFAKIEAGVGTDWQGISYSNENRILEFSTVSATTGAYTGAGGGGA